MEGKSHRIGGVLVALVGYSWLRSRGFLLEGVNPLVQLAVIYPASIVGSVLPDQDHHEESAPLKDVISWSFCKLLHLTTNTRKRMLAMGVSKKDFWYRVLGVFDARHRSWQTHSDLSFFLVVWLLLGVLSSGGILTAELVILKLLSVGLVLGLLSHLVLDMLTPSGVWSLAFKGINHLMGKKVLPEKIRFVPNAKFFSTGGPWERGWRWGMSFVSVFVFAYILYGLLPFEIAIGP